MARGIKRSCPCRAGRCACHRSGQAPRPRCTCSICLAHRRRLRGQHGVLTFEASGSDVLDSMALAASNRSLRVRRSPHFEIRRLMSTSPDWWRPFHARCARAVKLGEDHSRVRLEGARPLGPRERRHAGFPASRQADRRRWSSRSTGGCATSA